MIKEFVNRCIKYIVILIASSIIGIMLLVLAYLLPVSRMRENVSDMKEIEWEAGEYLLENVAGSYLNNYTDAFMLNTAICEGKGSVLEKSNAAYSYEYKDNGVDSFLRYLNEEEGYKLAPYARYWNGYLVILKPLLLFFSYYDIRTLNLILQSVLYVWCIIEIIRAGKKGFLIPFMGATLMMFPPVIAKSMHFSVVYYILLISMIIAVRYAERLEGKWEYFFLCIGMVVTYFELSTYPMITLLYPLIYVEITKKEGSDLITRIKRIISYSWAWCFGYIGLWGIKWIISSIVLGDNIIVNALGQILFRTSGADLSGDKVARIDVLILNFKDYSNNVIICICTIAVLTEVVYVVMKNKKDYSVIDRSTVCELIILALIPMIWLMAKTNHSYIHHWMTHRELSVSFLVLFILVGNLSCGLYHKLFKGRREDV